MIKNLMGKLNKPAKPVTDPEILALRKKFSELKGPAKPGEAPAQPGAPAQPAVPAAPQPAQPPAGAPPSAPTPAQPAPPMKPGIQPATAHTVPTAKDVKIKLLDVEQAEQDERMTNMIMEQIKELIEIDDNLNGKIKDVNSNLEENKKELAKLTDLHDKAMTRMDLIEKNMEKFIQLYEVVSNQYNPFLEKKEGVPVAPPAEVPPQPEEKPAEEKTEEQPEAPTTVPTPEQPAETPAPEQPAPPQEPVEQSAEPTAQPPAEPEHKPTPQEHEDEPVLVEDPRDTQNAAVAGQPVAQPVPGQPPPVMEQGAGTPPVQPTTIPIVEDQIEQMSDINDVVEHKINEALTDFKAKFHNEVNVNIEAKVNEMVGRIEQSINQQLNDGIKHHIEEEVREKLTKMVEGEQQSPAGAALIGDSTPSPDTPAPEQPALQEAEQTPEQEGIHHDEEVHPDNYFWLPDGTPIKSLSELANVLTSMDDATFQSHVTDERNDFSEWMKNVLQKPELADQVSGKNKDEMIQLVQQHMQN